MERDLDCIRYILIKIEENVSPSSKYTSSDLVCEEYDEETISYHLELLIDHDCIEVISFSVLGRRYPAYIITRLTMKGHDYLDTFRNEEIFTETKKEMKSKGITVALEIAASIATKLIKEKLNLPL